MTYEIKQELSMSFEMLLLEVSVFGDCGLPSQELHDTLKKVYMKGAEKAIEILNKKKK